MQCIKSRLTDAFIAKPLNTDKGDETHFYQVAFAFLCTMKPLVLFAFLVIRPLNSAYKLNSPENIKKAVVSGVLSIIVLDACLAVGFSVWWYGLLLLLLYPLSVLLSKIFTVT